MILTDDRPVLEPLLRSALEHEKKVIQLGIVKTQQRLAEFEHRYGISSVELEHRLHTLEMAETPELSEWRMEIGMRRLLERQYTALQNARLN
jgi:hypothetical protein